MTEFRLMDYVPIVLMFVVAGGFAVTNIFLTQLVGPRKSTKVKLMPYECGKDPVGSARERFSVKFYSVAVDFLLFDLEVLFLIPFAVAFGVLLNIKGGFYSYALPAYVAVMIFIGMVIIGFIYAWKKGTFEWNVQARAEARAEAKALFAERKNVGQFQLKQECPSNLSHRERNQLLRGGRESNTQTTFEEIKWV